MRLSLDYDLLRDWRAILIATFFMVIAYQSIIYLHPENIDWIGSDDFSVSNLFWFLLVDQFLIECITVTLVFVLIRFYARKLDLSDVRLEPKQLFYYQLKFLPILLTAFFVFAPFSLSARYLLHYAPNLDKTAYFEEYFYSLKLYINYLTPILLVGYSIININLIKIYNEQLGKTKSDLNETKRKRKNVKLRAKDDYGELLLDLDRIIWIERSDRKTFAYTLDEKYLLRESISQLEEKLDAFEFIRINRAVVVNLSYLLNYSFWENDKYIVRIKSSDKEFVMSRERLNKVKHRFFEYMD